MDVISVFYTRCFFLLFHHPLQHSPPKKTRGKVSRSKNRSTPPPLPIPNKLTSWQLISATCCWLYMGQMIIIWCVDIQNSSTLQMSVVNVECFPLSWWLQTYCKTFIEYIHTHIPPCFDTVLSQHVFVEGSNWTQTNRVPGSKTWTRRCRGAEKMSGENWINWPLIWGGAFFATVTHVIPDGA